MARLACRGKLLRDELSEQRARLLARAAPLEADVGAFFSPAVDAVAPAAAYLPSAHWSHGLRRRGCMLLHCGCCPGGRVVRCGWPEQCSDSVRGLRCWILLCVWHDHLRHMRRRGDRRGLGSIQPVHGVQRRNIRGRRINNLHGLPERPVRPRCKYASRRDGMPNLCGGHVLSRCANGVSVVHARTIRPRFSSGHALPDVWQRLLL